MKNFVALIHSSILLHYIPLTVTVTCWHTMLILLPALLISTQEYTLFSQGEWCSWNWKKLLEWLSYCSDSYLSFKSLYCRNGLACGCASIYIICEFNYNYSCSFIHFLFVYSNGLIVLVCKIKKWKCLLSQKWK